MKPCVVSRHLDVFAGTLKETDPRQVAEVLRGSGDKKTTPLQPIFFALSLKTTVQFRWRRERLIVFSGVNPTCQVLSKSIQVSEIY